MTFELAEPWRWLWESQNNKWMHMHEWITDSKLLLCYIFCVHVCLSMAYIIKYFKTSKVKHMWTLYKAIKIQSLFLFSSFLLAAVSSAARLMGCTIQRLMSALSTHRIQAGKDSVAKKLTLQQVCFMHLSYNRLSLFSTTMLFVWMYTQAYSRIIYLCMCTDYMVQVFLTEPLLLLLSSA